jgi:peptide/nickel transport system substrate-binding protein
MTRTDTVIVGTLVALLAVLALLIGAPAIQLASAPASASPSPDTSAPGFEVRPYVEGVVGAPDSVSPLTATTQADRDLVALLFSGLVRNGPGGTLVPDLAERWSVDGAGKTWTVDLREDARWHDGTPVTPDDVVFTIETLQDPAYTGTSGTSWSEVTVAATGPRQVRFTLTTPLGGFLQAATQPIAPAHVLAGVPPDLISDDPFGTDPIGSGPFRLTTFDTSRAALAAVPPVEPPGNPGRPNFATPRPTDSLLTPSPTRRPDVAVPHLATMELRFYDDLELLRGDWEAGRLDAVSGLQPAAAREFASAGDGRLVRYPGTTLLAATINLRASREDFQDAAVRRALLQAIDRDALVSSAIGGLGMRADSLIPPSSTMYDAEANVPVAFDLDAAREALRDAEWRASGGSWIPKDGDEPLVIELLSPEEAVNPVAYATAVGVRDAWHELGLAVRLVPLPPTELIGDRLARGNFDIAILPLAIGLDPDLYPLMAASQTRSGGSNVAGLQDPELDELLVAARTPVDATARATAYSELQKRLVANTYILPFAFRDEYVVFRDTVEGPQSRPIGGSWERFWDVLTWRLADGSQA